ncbi:MAG TPA: glutamate formimidoyltransferase [Candidatus Kapabacteria bacterium]|jgi:glutamate formiminotransferase/formiminotetrahydrofolate cyclodeaminase|nr:glutamate formimidoyltransferase [Candidatus Kapabacteria bacterium]
MRKIVECVPNFSEGRNSEIIEAIANAIRNTPGCTLLDVDPGKSTNRTVYTFVGSPEAVLEGALASARVAYKLIDMRHHKGEHPRMGAMDVCPFIPVSDVTMDECVALSEEFGRRASAELGIPIYLYEYSAKADYRRKLPDIRAGEYEGLPEKLLKPEWRPDFGPAEFIPNWGATATGARNFLIAYNVNVLGTKQQAHRIALNLRETGRGIDNPGLLKEVKAIGWWVDEYNMAQISMNLTNYEITPPHIAFESAKAQAKLLNVGIAGSELVGLIPLKAILMAADYYIKNENLIILEEEQKIKLAIDRLGLNSITRFEPKKKIIEYMIEDKSSERLVNLTVKEFINEIAARTSSPGGGSASAAIAAIGAGLGTMVGQLTYGIRKFENVDKEIRAVLPKLYDTTQALIPMIDRDTQAFDEYMKAMHLPKDTPEEEQIRNRKMQEGIIKAIEVPLTTMKLANSIWNEMQAIAKFGNIASHSDVEVGAKALETGIWGAYKNVLINLPLVEDENYRNTILDEAKQIVEAAHQESQKVLNIISQRIEKTN